MTSFKAIFPALFSFGKNNYLLAYIFVTQRPILIFFFLFHTYALHNVKMAVILQSYM